MTVFSRNSVASPEALANIPEETVRTWPTGLVPQGHQLSDRYGLRRTGLLKQHATGCRVNGGTLPTSKCRKCAEVPAFAVVRARSAETKR